VASGLFQSLLAECASDAAEESLLASGSATVPAACLAEGQPIADAVHRAYLHKIGYILLSSSFMDKNDIIPNTKL